MQIRPIILLALMGCTKGNDETTDLESLCGKRKGPYDSFDSLSREEEVAKKAAEEEAAKQAADEEATKKAAEDEAARKATEEEAKRKADEEVAWKKKAEEDDGCRREWAPRPRTRPKLLGEFAARIKKHLLLMELLASKLDAEDLELHSDALAQAIVREQMDRDILPAQLVEKLEL